MYVVHYICMYVYIHVHVSMYVVVGNCDRSRRRHNDNTSQHVKNKLILDRIFESNVHVHVLVNDVPPVHMYMYVYCFYIFV